MARLSLIEYLSYVEGTNTSRSVREGEEVLNAGHIILCGKMNSSTAHNILICALCLQSSALTSDPHNIQGELYLDPGTGGIKIRKMLCTCKAGNSGKCKHISAVLIRCTRENLEDLEVISQTDLKCVWSTQKHMTSEKYRAVPIEEMPCFQNKIEKYELAMDNNDMFNFFKSRLPESAISKHDIGRRSFTGNCSNENEVPGRDYFRAILDNACQSIIMLETAMIPIVHQNDCCEQLVMELFSKDADLIINIPQQSKEWHEQRKYRVTGSRIYDLFTYAKNDWDNKSKKYFYGGSFHNKYTKHGVKFESDAKEAFIARTCYNVVDCGMVVSNSNPWLGYSPDGVIFEHDRPVALLEVKCLYEGATKSINEALQKCRFIEKRGKSYFVREKHKYYAQVQLGMALLNVNTCYFVLYASFDKSLEILEIEFNNEYTKKLLNVTKKKFFEKMLHVICMSNKL